MHSAHKRKKAPTHKFVAFKRLNPRGFVTQMWLLNASSFNPRGLNKIFYDFITDPKKTHLIHIFHKI
jgi:hypothetical protein